MIDFVIRNLLSNALKFTQKEDCIEFTVVEETNALRVFVKDTGVGMTPEQLDKLLAAEGESFTTEGTQNEKGSGLGLSICKDFIQRNRGKIEIQSTKGFGTTFSFTVPTTLTTESILVDG